MLSVLVNLVEEMADLCALKRVSLNTVSAFSDQDDEWPLALLSIYESIYTFECKKMQAMMKAKGLTADAKRGIPNGVTCYSTAIRPLIAYIDQWRAKYYSFSG